MCLFSCLVSPLACARPTVIEYVATHSPIKMFSACQRRNQTVGLYEGFLFSSFFFFPKLCSFHKDLLSESFKWFWSAAAVCIAHQKNLLFLKLHLCLTSMHMGEVGLHSFEGQLWYCQYGVMWGDWTWGKSS